MKRPPNTHASLLLDHPSTQELMTFAEESTFEFRLFTGEVIKLFQDGTFSIDDFICPGLVYTGVADCV